MKIKNIRNPNEEEKENIIPYLKVFGISVAIITALIYFMDFSFYNVGEILYKTSSFPNREIAIHNLIVQIFEGIYNRSYMLNKLEGVSVSAILSTVINVAMGIPIYIKDKIKGR